MDAPSRSLFQRLGPARFLTLGFLSYVMVGTALLSLPFAQKMPTGFIDDLFIAISGVSTTGLTTVSVSDSYTLFGQAVILVLFQIGGLGYMTFSSFIIIARNQNLSRERMQILEAGLPLPEHIQIRGFLKMILVYSLCVETIGTLLLYAELRGAGLQTPLWSAFFHSVSSFTTAGFSLNNDSFEKFAANGTVNFTLCVICYLGGLGFIVAQDAWLSLVKRDHRVTLTTKIILSMSATIFVAGTLVMFFEEPLIRGLPFTERLYAASFQVMTASTTTGFNTLPISSLSAASLTLIIVVMVIGASPSGTGGGIKSTAVTALYAILASVLRGSTHIRFRNREIPSTRLLTAVALTTFYMTILVLGLYLLSITENADYLDIAFEAASALGTVGLSMGLTPTLTVPGKIVVSLLMFIGRVGPLTIGFSLIPARGRADLYSYPEEDVAI